MSYIHLPQDNLSYVIAIDILTRLTNPFFKNKPTTIANISMDKYSMISQYDILQVLKEFLYYGLVDSVTFNLQKNGKIERSKLFTKNDVSLIEVESSFFDKSFKELSYELISKEELNRHDPVRKFALTVNKQKIENWLNNKIEIFKSGKVHNSVVNYEVQLKELLNIILQKGKSLTFSNIEMTSQIVSNPIGFPLLIYKLQSVGLIRVDSIYFDFDRPFLHLTINILKPNIVSYDKAKNEIIFNELVKVRLTNTQSFMVQAIFEEYPNDIKHGFLEDEYQNKVAAQEKNNKWQNMAKNINKRIAKHYPVLSDFLDTKSTLHTNINPTYKIQN